MHLSHLLSILCWHAGIAYVSRFTNHPRMSLLHLTRCGTQHLTKFMLAAITALTDGPVSNQILGITYGLCRMGGVGAHERGSMNKGLSGQRDSRMQLLWIFPNSILTLSLSNPDNFTTRMGKGEVDGEMQSSPRQ